MAGMVRKLSQSDWCDEFRYLCELRLASLTSTPSGVLFQKDRIHCVPDVLVSACRLVGSTVLTTTSTDGPAPNFVELGHSISASDNLSYCITRDSRTGLLMHTPTQSGLLCQTATDHDVGDLGTNADIIATIVSSAMAINGNTRRISSTVSGIGRSSSGAMCTGSHPSWTALKYPWLMVFSAMAS